MPETERIAELNEGFSEPGAQAPPWADVAEVLSGSEMFWLSTVRRDEQAARHAAAGHLARRGAVLLLRRAGTENP